MRGKANVFAELKSGPVGVAHNTADAACGAGGEFAGEHPARIDRRWHDHGARRHHLEAERTVIRFVTDQNNQLVTELRRRLSRAEVLRSGVPH